MKARNNLLLHCYIVILLIVLISLTACGRAGDTDVDIVGQKSGIEQAETESDVDDEVNKVNKVVNKIVNNNDGDESQVYFLNIDGESFEIEAPDQGELTAYDVLNLYSKKQNVSLKTKNYDFGIFVEGIGDKIGDKNHFWLYYINDKMATASADKTKVKAGDVIKFIYTGESPF